MSAKLQEAVRYTDPLCSHDYIPMPGLARTASGNHFQRTDDFDPEYRPLVIEALKKHFFFKEELKDYFLRKPNSEQ